MFHAHHQPHRGLRGNHGTGHERDQRQSGLTRRNAKHGLAIERRINDDADDGADGEKSGTDDRAGHAAAEDGERNERLAGASSRGAKRPHSRAEATNSETTCHELHK